MLYRRAISIALLAVALASSSLAPAAEPHKLIGTWVVDVSRFDQPNHPKSVTLTLQPAEAGAYNISVDIEAPDGQVMHSAGQFKPDGTAVSVKGSMDVDVVAMSMPNSRTLVMAGGFQGHPASSRVWTLSDDGKEMIEFAIRHLPDGTPYMRKFYWKRKALKAS
jgi:hypothetical protein